MIQSHILYNKHIQLQNLKAKPLDGFVKSVCNEFSAAIQQDDSNAQPTGAADPDATTDMLRLRPGEHCPVTIPPANAGQTRKAQRGCKVCCAKRKKEGASTEELKKKHTSIMCMQWKVPLCIDLCFRLFHTAEDYTK